MTGKLPPLKSIPLGAGDAGVMSDTGSDPSAMLGMSSLNLSSNQLNVAEDTEKQYTRQPDPKSPNAIRCRTFHAKMTEGALHFLDEQVNRFLESHGYECKHAHLTLGQFQSKNVETHLIVQVWY